MLLSIRGITEESLQNGTLKDFDGYRSFEIGLITPTRNISDLYGGWSSYCKRHNAIYQRRGCVSKDGDLLFFADAKTTGNLRGNNSEYSIYVIEPHIGSKKNFVKAAALAGYIDEKQHISYRRAQEEEKLKQLIEKEQRKLNGEQEITQSGIGSRVCKDTRIPGAGRNFVQVGYVEQIANSNIKVSVQLVHAEDVSSPAPEKFKPYKQWFPIKQWYLCQN